MDRIAGARARLEEAGDLPSILDAAYDAFEDMLTVIEDHQDPDEGTFTVFVMAGVPAAGGRDAVAGAPSLPPAPASPRPIPGAGLVPDVSAAEAAAAVAGLSLLLVSRLDAAAGLCGDVADRTACSLAAQYAASVSSVLAGARRS